jgi:hypothetical protein
MAGVCCLKRVLQHDLGTCPRCGGKAEVLAVIIDPTVVRRILDHLGLPATPPRRGPAQARAPPTALEDDGPTIDDCLTDEMP